MKLKFWLRILLMIPLFLVSIVAWMLFTELGFKALVFSVKPFVPGTLEMQNIQGSFFKTIVLEDLEYQNEGCWVKAKRLQIKPKWIEFLGNGLKLDDIHVEQGTVLLTNRAKPFAVEVTIFRGRIIYQPIQDLLDISVNEFHGTFNNQSLFFRGGLQWKAGVMSVQKSFVEWGKYRVRLKPHKKSEESSGTKKGAEDLAIKNGAEDPAIKNGSAVEKSVTTIELYLPFDANNPHYGFGEIIFQKEQLSVEGLNLFQAKKKVLTFKGSLKAPAFSLNTPFSTQKIMGSYQTELVDLTPVYRIAPVISRLKAKPALQGDISGTLSKPIVTLKGTVGNAIFSVPKQKVTIKNFQLMIEGTLGGQENILNITSSGTLGEKPFHITGWIHPLKAGMPAQLELKGHRLRILNSPRLFALASPDLILNYEDKILDIQGNVTIDEANVAVKDENSIVISEDVFLVGEKMEALHPDVIKIIPHITVKIEDNARFKGYGLDALVKGNIVIAQRKDGLYTGEGDITFAKGKYRLPNGIGHIRKGHLFYPSGTLLKDPILDIRVIQKQTESLAINKEVGVTVEGTLQKPVYHLYSNEPLDRSTILSELGGVGKQITGQDNTNALSQSAVLVGGGANPIIENIQNKLKLDEFGLQSHETKYYSTQDGNDTALVVGKALSKRIYLKYIQGVWVPSKTLRLLYFLSPRAAVSGEISSSGLGGDISFSTERN